MKRALFFLSFMFLMTSQLLADTSYHPPNGTIMVYKRNYFPYIAPTFIQNTDISKSQYLLAGDYTAGSHVDNILTNGEVTVKSGIEYEIEHSGKVTLGGGFKVEKGATFIVKPACYIK